MCVRRTRTERERARPFSLRFCYFAFSRSPLFSLQASQSASGCPVLNSDQSVINQRSRRLVRKSKFAGRRGNTGEQKSNSERRESPGGTLLPRRAASPATWKKDVSRADGSTEAAFPVYRREKRARRSLFPGDSYARLCGFAFLRG